MITKEEISAKESAIVEYLTVAHEKLAVCQKEKDTEGIASATYLIAEYEQMLEEFREYYSISKT